MAYVVVVAASSRRDEPFVRPASCGGCKYGA